MRASTPRDSVGVVPVGSPAGCRRGGAPRRDGRDAPARPCDESERLPMAATCQGIGAAAGALRSSPRKAGGGVVTTLQAVSSDVGSDVAGLETRRRRQRRRWLSRCSARVARGPHRRWRALTARLEPRTSAPLRCFKVVERRPSMTDSGLCDRSRAVDLASSDAQRLPVARDRRRRPRVLAAWCARSASHAAATELKSIAEVPRSHGAVLYDGT